MSDFTDTYAQMDLRALAADAIRERDRLRIENHTLRTVIDACTEKQREDALVHIRLRDGLRRALDVADRLVPFLPDNTQGRVMADLVREEIAELRKLVQP